jgi:hypothetical protein
MKAAFVLLAGVALASNEYVYHDGEKTDYPVVSPCPECPEGYGPPDVTVTKPYQMVPTCSPMPNKAVVCSDYAYVSTVLTDAKGDSCTVTKTNQPVTLCHTKTKITKTYGASSSSSSCSSTSSSSSASSASSHSMGMTYGAPAYPTPSVYYEEYEKSCEAPYDHLGPIALPGYEGSGLCGAECEGKHGAKYQPMKVTECRDGVCTTYDYTATHAAPAPKVTSYDAAGTYTIDEYDVTVTKPTTVPAAASCSAKAREPVTYGGVVTHVPRPTTITVAYPVEKKHGANTKTYVKYITKVCPSAGTYTVVEPETTTYDHDTTFTYPTVSVYKPGVYHHDKEVVTVTKPGEAYTCSLSKQPGVYPTSTKTAPYKPDPSSDNGEPTELYGRADAGYSHHGGIIKRAEAPPAKRGQAGSHKKRVILV